MNAGLLKIDGVAFLWCVCGGGKGGRGLQESICVCPNRMAVALPDLAGMCPLGAWLLPYLTLHVPPRCMAVA